MLHALSPVRTVAPAVYPVTLAEVKARLSVEHSDHDLMINDMIAEATSRLDAQGILGAALITQTWRFDLAGFPGCDHIRLPFGPVQSVVVTYYDDDNASQTYSSGSYYVLTDMLGPKLLLDDLATWPNTYTRPNAVSVTAVVGYGATPASIPAELRSAIFIMIGDLYRHRESVMVGVSVSTIPTSMAVHSLIEGRRKVGIS